MPLLKIAGMLGLCCLCALSQTTTSPVGNGSTADVQTAFVAAYNRNGFSALVGAPNGNVTAFLSTGLIQTFPGANNKTQTYALIKPDATSTMNVVQAYPDMFGYYGYLGYANAGFPTIDTTACPTLVSAAAAGNSCQYQTFSGDYALFLYNYPLPNGASQLFIADPYDTLWNNLGGTSTMGPATAVLSQIASQHKSSAITQAFDQGTIDNLNGGAYTGTFGVRPPIYQIYAANGAEAGSMGFPVSAEILLPNGMRQQAFERGAISYNPATLVATQQPPVASVTVSAGATLQMFPGGTSPVQASLAAAGGVAVVGRPVVWSSSNTKVVQIQGSGTSVILYAVASGSATVTAAAEGQSSVLNVVVSSSYCCMIGQGAPTAAIQQAFQDAVSRDQLNVVLPAASGVTRLGAGYVQQLTGSSGVTYLVAVPDSISTGYVVAGALLTQYLQLGGPAGSLGYPLSDATSGGRQLFQNGALAGNPVQLVTGAILSGWQSLGYETGLAGLPTGGAAAFVTFRGTTGVTQNFQSGEILAAAAGSLANVPYLVSGLVLATYKASGGTAGNLGAPITLERPVNGQQRQDFEGGYIHYTVGSSQATEVDTPRQPLVTATPGAVRAGTLVHLVIGGFNNGASVRVSQSGQVDFVVTTSGGTYAWDSFVSSTANPGTITVKAADTASSATAQATYTVYTTASSALTINAISGNQQNGAPGANLPHPLVAVVKDQDGNPMAGQTVIFAASPGGQVQPASAVTDANGMASTAFRMPPTAGVALATASAGRQVATFSAASSAFSLTNFPALTQAVNGTLGNASDTIQNKGALLTAAASILRYHQSRGELPQPDGLADATTLNQFLTSFCATDSQGNKICDGFVTIGASAEQTVNLWRLGAFVSNGLTIEIEPFDLNSIRDLVVSGEPVLVALSLGNLGSHFVVASGVAADGSILISDPNPAFAQTDLNGYLNGFTASGQAIKGTLTGAVHLLPQAPASPGFIVVANTSISLATAAGSCGSALTFPGVAAVAGATPSYPPGALYFGACDGTSSLYELNAAGPGPYNLTFTDLSPTGSRIPLTGAAAASWAIAGGSQPWSAAPLTTVIAGSVLNAASYTNQIAPGGLISIFGAGLAGSGATAVQVNGQSARVIAATPFQVNAQIPAGAVAGSAQLTVTSSNGTAQQQTAIASVAPAIFSISASQAAITNSDNSLNGPANPANRGGVVVIYATGFGATAASGAATTPVSVVIGGATFSAAYAGVSPGTPGLYQVNVALPATMPPGLALPLYLKQGGAMSNTVTVAVE
jgi:uncharacterized protein (TIGR03437 family)